MPGVPSSRETCASRFFEFGLKVLWDREWIYFLAEMDDTEIKATHQGRDAGVWNDDALSIFPGQPARQLTRC